MVSAVAFAKEKEAVPTDDYNQQSLREQVQSF